MGLEIAKLKVPSFGLQGKSALVAGASRGLGAAAAVALSHAGANVTAIARSGEIKEVAKLIDASARKYGGSCRGAVLDILDEAGVQTFVAAGDISDANKTMPYSILVCNAGTNIPEPATQVSAKNFDAVFSLNVRASFFLSTAVARHLMIAHESDDKLGKSKSKSSALGGSIIHVSSQMGHVGALNRSVYAASKHAVQGFVKSMAWEWGKNNIRVNALCPTFIKTPLTIPMLADKNFLKTVQDNIAFGRVGKMEEIMGPIVFLASDAASLVTGSSLMVDGGWTAK